MVTQPRQLPIIEDPHDVGLHRDSDAPGATVDRPTRAMREAAVLVPLVREHGAWHVLFIRRAHREGDRHSGQVAFPGGMREANDRDLEHTALRETEEELGLDAAHVNVITCLRAYTTVSDFRVTPVVGIVDDWPLPLTLQALEVARAFTMPLDWLRRRENFTFRARRDMDRQSALHHPIIVFEPWDGETLWGATARMTVNFIKAIDDGDIELPIL